jgi:hypothetical protein
MSSRSPTASSICIGSSGFAMRGAPTSSVAAREAAARTLREALELWRGRPFADLENEPFAPEATAALDEAWLATLQSRIEADLALGRRRRGATTSASTAVAAPRHRRAAAADRGRPERTLIGAR